MPGAFPSVATAATQAQLAVLPVTQIPAERAATLLRTLFPNARVSTDTASNAIVVVASPSDIERMRALVAGIDVRSPIARTIAAIPLQVERSDVLVPRLRALFPAAGIEAGPHGRSLIVAATPADFDQIRGIVASLDTLPAEVAHGAREVVAIRVTQTSTKTVARALAGTFPRLRVSVSGTNVLVDGVPDDVDRARSLAPSLDVPPAGARIARVYRIRSYDADSVAGLVRQTYPRANVAVQKELNALTVIAGGADQSAIGDAIAALDAGRSGSAEPGTAGPPIGDGSAAFQVYTLRAALPGANGAPSTSASDIAQAVTQALGPATPDLRITVAPQANQLILVGSPGSLALARQLIDQLDVAQKLVVLDTQVLELDESVTKDLGLSFTQPILSTTYSEVTPPNDANGNAQRLLGLAPLTRTPLSLGVQLNLLVQNGHGRVLANPRITTVSGRTATIRAGDTISIQTTAGGGAGTVATTQLQTFQTGVTLDITPVVNAGDFVSVLLHPTVNSETALLNGIPQISTRDTQTTVTLHNDETLVIGGLIQSTENRTDTKIPVLGDLPLVGHVFRDNQVSSTENELVITVTPHVIEPGEPLDRAGSGLPAVPPLQALPTVPPDAILRGPAATSVYPPQAPPVPLPPSAPQAAAPTPVPARTPVPAASAIPGGPAVGPVPGGPVPANASLPGGPVVGSPVPGGPVPSTTIPPVSHP